MKQFRLKSALAGLLVALSALPTLEAQAQLPIDPSLIDQLTPEQRQKALDVFGAGGGQPLASPDGRFHDQTLGGTTAGNRRTAAGYGFDPCDPRYYRSTNGSGSASGATRANSYLSGPGAASGNYGVPPSSGNYPSAGYPVTGYPGPNYPGGNYPGSNYPGAAAAANVYPGVDPSGAAGNVYGYGNPNVPIPAGPSAGAAGTNASGQSLPSQVECAQRYGNAYQQRGYSPYSSASGATLPLQPVLRPFGYDALQGNATTFAPATDIPVPSEYVLGPGDNIRVQLFGNDTGNYSLQVGRDGQINFPKLGPISVAGQRFEDVKANLTARVTRELIGVQSSISLGELRSVNVLLTGDVNQPGSYTVSSLATITNALIAGGGVSFIGSLRNIQLKRAGRVVGTLDLYALLLRGDSTGDQRLQAGDVIFVPPVGARVSIDGEVKRPAIYELKGEHAISEILVLAGGLPASTNTSTAQIERFDGNKKTVRQIDLARASDLSTAVKDGDLLRVGSIAQRLENNVAIAGYVKYPGAYQWSEGYTLQALLKTAQMQPSDKDAEAYLALGLIERTDPRSGVRAWQSFNVADVMAGAGTPPTLQRDDLVLILTREDIAYLDSKAVRDVANGDFTAVQTCPALEGLARLVNSERSIRFVKAFKLEGTTDGEVAASNYVEAAACPDVFRQAPRALQYLLEEAVAVYGEVRHPGLYPVVPGTSLRLLIEVAGGLTNEGDPGNIEYISYQDALAKGRSEYVNVDLQKPEGDGLRINPGDLLKFKPRYLGQETGTVKLAGEFRFPGSYGILRGERMSQLIQRAGGVTPIAYPYGAIFTRESARKAEQDSYRRAASDLQEAAATALTSGALGKDAQLSSQFLSVIVSRLENAKAIGRVVIDADPKVLAAKPEIDPIVEPGDVLFMPKQPISVTVIGQVLNPGSLLFDRGASIKKYVERAGGYSQAADEGRVFVILPNGTARKFETSFWGTSSGDIPPGSVIVVPRDAAPFNGLAFFERAFSVLSNLAVTAAALATVTR